MATVDKVAASVENPARPPLSRDPGRGGAIPAVGGAMDLPIGAKQVFVMTALFAKDGSPKLVPRCTYPLTGRACVDRMYTPTWRRS